MTVAIDRIGVLKRGFAAVKRREDVRSDAIVGVEIDRTCCSRELLLLWSRSVPIYAKHSTNRKNKISVLQIFRLSGSTLTTTRKGSLWCLAAKEDDLG